MLSATLAALRSIDGLTLRVGWTDPEVARIVAVKGSRSGTLTRATRHGIKLPPNVTPGKEHLYAVQGPGVRHEQTFQGTPEVTRDQIVAPFGRVPTPTARMFSRAVV